MYRRLGYSSSLVGFEKGVGIERGMKRLEIFRGGGCGDVAAGNGYGANEDHRDYKVE